MEKFLNQAKELAPLLALILLYSVIAFYNLGNRESPQTVWSETDAVIIDFGEVVHLSRFQFMLGARHNIPFMLYASEDGQNWHFELAIEESSVFSWAERPMYTYAKYAQIIAFREGLRLQEVAFRRRDNTLLVPYQLFTQGSEVLFDEQHMVPERRALENSTYFDEIYHARTAYEFINDLWVFETTHPPLGKSIIALGIRAFGMTPFGWRIAGTITGILMIPLMYMFGRLMFGKTWALFVAFIFTFDFMTLAQTRIATIDSYLVLFIIASYLCMYAYYKYSKELGLQKSLLLLLGSGVFIGLAIAVKWQGMYAALGLPVIFFPVWYKLYKLNKREAYITFLSCFGFFIAVPLLIYTLSYIPFVRIMDTGDGFAATVIANQQSMFSYHSALLDEHPFSSRWWEWPLIIRPVFYYANTVSGTVRQGISSFGNPAVWWVGIFALACAVSLLRDKAQKGYHADVIFLLAAYAAQYLPWIFVYRATFIYHYFPSVPFVVLLITLMFKAYITPKYPKLMWAYPTLVLGLFILFLPVLSGAPVSVDFVQTFLRWFHAWVLV